MSDASKAEKCIASWLNGMQHEDIAAAITETREEFEQSTSPNANSVQILASRMTLRGLNSLFWALWFNCIGIMATLFVLRQFLHGAAWVAKKICATVYFGFTTVWFVWNMVCSIWTTMCWGRTAIGNFIWSSGDPKSVNWTSLDSHWQSLWQPPSVETNMKHAGVWSFFSNSDQTPIQATIKANLGVLQLLCYLLAMILVALLLFVLYCLIDKILSKIFTLISEIFKRLCACSWVKHLQNSRANWLIEPIILVFTRLATYCFSIVSLGWKEFSKFNIPRAIFVAVFNALDKTWKFNTNSDNVLQEAKAMANPNGKAFAAAFREFFCVFLQKFASKAAANPVRICGENSNCNGSEPLLLQQQIQKIKQNGQRLTENPATLDTMWYDDLNMGGHQTISDTLEFNVEPYRQRLDSFRKSQNTKNTKKGTWYGLRTDFQQVTTRKHEHVKAGAKRIRHHQYVALFVLVVLLSLYGYIAFTHSQVSIQKIFTNSKLTTDLELINGQEMFLRTDQRQCFRNRSIFNDCMPPHLFRAYKTAHNATIHHFRKMDNATRTRCIENHTATEEDKPWFLGKLLAFFVSDDVSDESAPIEHQCLPLKEKDADLEKEEGFVHELEGRFHDERAKAGLSLDLMFLSQSRICFVNVSYDSEDVTKAYNSSIAKALSTPDYGLLTLLTLAADTHTHIHYCELGSVALKLFFCPLFLGLICMMPVLWLLQLHCNNRL